MINELLKSITKVRNSIKKTVNDSISIEEPLEIRICTGGNLKTHKSLTVTMRTPGNDTELVTGFLYSEGIIKNIKDIKNIGRCKVKMSENTIKVELKEELNLDLKKLDRNFYSSSSCGVCGKTSLDSLKFKENFDYQESIKTPLQTEVLYSLEEKLSTAQKNFSTTGGYHGTGLFDYNGKLIFVREDIGRHNSMDKVIGASLKRLEFPLTNYLFLFSGRLSFELMQKAIMCGTKTVISIGAPSSLAIQLAEKYNVTIIGFLKKNGYNVYN